MIRRPPRSTRVRSSAASDVYKRQEYDSVRIVAREEIERGRCLLETRPEYRRENEEQDDYDHALLVFDIEPATDKQVDKVDQRHGHYDEGHLLRHRNRTDVHEAAHREYHEKDNDPDAGTDYKLDAAMLGGISRCGRDSDVAQRFVGAE